MKFILLVVALLPALSATAALPRSMTPEQGEEPVMTFHVSKSEVSKRTKGKANRFGDDIKFGRLAERTDTALDAIIRLAVYKLARVGEKAAAAQLLKEWEGQWRGEIIRLSLSRGIGDHKPLSKWLAEKYDMLEFVLGKDVCHSLRLSDIKTINYAIPVVIRCVDDVDEMEYFLHFVADEINGYRGLGPVVAFWVTEFACVGFTWGSGFLFCGPIAQGVEYLVKSFVAPRLNSPLWKRVCAGDYPNLPKGALNATMD